MSKPQYLHRIFDLNHLLTQRGKNLAPMYRVLGSAPRGGVYNSHLMFVALLAIAASLQVAPWPIALWLIGCFSLALLIDSDPWHHKLRWTALPGQLWLYAQVFVQFARDVLPMYLLAFALYVGVAPIWGQAHLGFNTFVWLYGFYLVVRTGWLLRCLWIIAVRWDGPRPAPLHGSEANLRSRGTALRHILWAYFLGNVGVAVRCAVYVVTLALLEWTRTQTRLDLTLYPSLSPHLVTICIVSSVVWLLTLGAAMRRAQLVFYRAHRTFHEVKPLYDSIHSVHHKGVLPSPLDSGTISPAEFAITEYAIPATVITPDWYWTLLQVAIAVFGHWPGHYFGTKAKMSVHHVDHHRRFNVNFGLFPHDDIVFGTAYPEPAPVES